MSRFELQLLGSPQIVRPDGTLADLPRGKPMAMLCVLALEPTAVSRTDLAAMLWSTSSPSRARASIRQALWLLRKHTAPEIVVESNGHLALDPDRIATDLEEWTRLLDAGELDEALDRWSGGPLFGFEIADAPQWASWADRIRSRWEARFGERLEARADATSGMDRARWLQRALDIRPYRLDIRIRLIDELVDLRDLDAAEAALDELRDGAEPEDRPRVEEAEARVRLLRRSSHGDPEQRLVPEFVGRSSEFATLMSAWRAARGGEPRLVRVSGTPGIGKTALATEMLRHAEAAGALAVTVPAARVEADLTWSLLSALVRDLLRRPGAAGVSAASGQLLEGLVPSAAAGLPRVDPTAAGLIDALADLLAAVSHEHPLAVLIDDAQWMDAASAAVILGALRRVEEGSVLMIWTRRNNGYPADPARATVVDALRESERSGAAEELELSPLGPAEIEEMVALLLRTDAPDVIERLARAVHEASGGVPLHAVELLRELSDRGVLVHGDDGWRLAPDGPSLADVAGSLRETQDRRLRLLSPQARTVAGALAEAGRARSRRSLCEDTALPTADCSAAVSELIDRHVIRWTDDDRLELTHESLREAIRSHLDRDEPRPVWMRPWLAAAAIVLLFAIGVVGVRVGASDPIEPPPFGGGMLWLHSTNAVRGYRVLPGPRMVLVDSLFTSQAEQVTVLGLDTAGRPIVGGYTNSHPTDPPDAILLRDGRVDTVFSTPGEEALRVVRSQLDAGLFAVQHDDTTRWRMMVVRAPLDGSRTDTTVLAAGEAHYNPLSWTPDGRHVLVHVNHTWDSLAVMDPGGRLLHQFPSPHPVLDHVTPCGPDRILAGSFPPAGYREHWFWSLGAEETVPWTPTDTITGRPSCSPDGTAVAYLARSGDRYELVIEPIDGGVQLRRDLTGTGAYTLMWAPDAEAVPVRVALEDRALELTRGLRDTLVARVLASDSGVVDRVVEWVSDEPATASVDEFGIVTANRPGTTWVRARVDGWLEDSLAVVVSDSADPPQLLFADSFPTFDADRWVVAGEPHPRPVRLDDGSPALALRGDGNYSDRIDTAAEFDLSMGGTLEARFRFSELDRLDRQRFTLCLVEGEERGDHPDMRTSQSQCLQWPAGEGLDFRSDVVRFAQDGLAIGDIPIGALAQPGEWTTLAIQVTAGGEVQAIVNDSIVATHPGRLTVSTDHRFHIRVSHAAVDTELLLRDVILWNEPRYR